MNVLTIKQMTEGMEAQGYKVSRLTITTKLTPILAQAGLAQRIEVGSMGVWVFEPEALPLLITYLKRHAEIVNGSHASKHSIEAFMEYTGGADVSHQP